MAGIAGYFGAAQAPEVLQAMVRKMTHRGRDGEAFYLANPVFMGLRDKAARAGEQPFYNIDETIAVIFAGDIVNYSKIRADLSQKGMMFRGETTAELILHLYEAYGVNAVNHLRGKFVFAVHDTMKDLVFLARDHMGATPLYYATTPSGSFVFASEIKSVLEHPGIQVTPDMVGIDAYLSMGYSPGPDSLFKGIHKLPAGHRLIWNPGLHVMIEPYWQWESFMTPDAALKTDEDFQEHFGTLLDDAVRVSSSSAVPAGVLLNGTVEDTAVAMSLVGQSDVRVHSFGVGFGGDETTLLPGREIAQRLDTQHHEVMCNPSDMAKLPEIIWAMDEPIADPALVPLYMALQQGSSVSGHVLSGAGADELLSGSVPHRVFIDAHRASRPVYSLFKLGVRYMPMSWLDKQFDCSGRLGVRCRQRLMNFFDEMRSNHGMMRRYACLISLFDAQDKGLIYGDTMSPFMETFIDMQKEVAQWPTLLSSMLALQKDHALQDQTMMRLDRMSVLGGVDARAPFTDHPLAEFLMGVPDHLKYHHGRNKVLLRNHLDKVLPRVAEQPRRTASLPLTAFMGAQPLREMMDSCLSESSIKKRGLFEWEGVKNLLARARQDDVLLSHQVFSLFMLELWFRIYVDHEKGWISK